MLSLNNKVITSTISLELRGLFYRSGKSLHLQEMQCKDLAYHTPIASLFPKCHWMSFLSFGVVSSISLTCSLLPIIKLRCPNLTLRESPKFNLERLRNVCFVKGWMGCIMTSLWTSEKTWLRLVCFHIFSVLQIIVMVGCRCWVCFPCTKSLCNRG